jgi:hypothetical protein
MSDSANGCLPLAQRAKRYRERALDLRSLAQSAVASVSHNSLLKVAGQWEQLAADVERRIARRNDLLS